MSLRARHRLLFALSSFRKQLFAENVFYRCSAQNLPVFLTPGRQND